MKFAAFYITSIPVSCSTAANCSGETSRPLHLRWLNREGASRPPPFDPHDEAPRVRSGSPNVALCHRAVQILQSFNNRSWAEL